jgi:SET domain-containing protein
MNYQAEPITMWFDRRLVLRKSPIHGIGTFATHDIDAGELLMLVTGGLIVTAEDQQPDKLQLVADMYNQESLAEDVFILTPKLFHYYINHSCDPNAVDISRRGNSTQYIALRNIHANEEITADYYNETTLQVCLCKSPHCRWIHHES